MKFITTDFELGLINALEEVFPGVRKVGCFYHFVRAIKEKFKKLEASKKKENNEKNIINLDNQILNDIFTLPFSIYKTDYTTIDSLCNKYENNYPEFIGYFRAQWVPFFI